MINWIDVKDRVPRIYEEVIVWVDGHRNPSWRNNFPMIAYLNEDNKWMKSYSPDYSGKVEFAVLFWSEINLPEQNHIK